MTKAALGLLILLLFFSSCDQNEHKPVDPIPADYKSWQKPINEPLEYAIPGHGDSKRIIYANRLAYQAKYRENANNRRSLSFPDGAIIVKEVYRKKQGVYETYPQLTVMVKDTKDKNAQNGWLFYVRNPNSPQVMLIKNRLCIGCHEAANETHPYFDQNLEGIFRDYVFVALVK